MTSAVSRATEADAPPKRTRRRKKAAAAESTLPIEAPKPPEYPACEVCGTIASFTHRMYRYSGERVLKRQVCQDCAAKDRTLFDRLGPQGGAPNRKERRTHLHQHQQRSVVRAKAIAGAAPHAYRH